MIIVLYRKSMMILFSNGWIWLNQHDDGTINSKNIMNCMSNGHWTLSIEHWSMSIKHWALSIKHWALSIEHWALSIEHWALSIYHIRSIHKRPALFFLSLRRPTPTCWDKYYRKLYVQVYLHTCFETLYCRQFVALHFVLNCDCLASFLMSCILLPPAKTNITGNYTCR